VWLSERLAEHHRLDTFTCGNAELDKWLGTSAVHSDRADNTRTYVWSNGDDVVAYFSLCPHEVRRDSLPGKLSKSGPASIPVILLAKLALHGHLHGQGLGGQLFVDALSRAVSAVDIAGGRLIVVDAIDEAAARFYEHFGFQRVPKPIPRLVMRSSAAKASFGTSEEAH
jgi:GNAT superfamily N-acetyltransferase